MKILAPLGLGGQEKAFFVQQSVSTSRPCADPLVLLCENGTFDFGGNFRLLSELGNLYRNTISTFGQKLSTSTRWHQSIQITSRNATFDFLPPLGFLKF